MTEASSTRIVALLLALIAAAAALALPPVQQVRDALYWAKEVERGTDLYALLNPHHLGYLPLVRSVFVGVREVCASCRAIGSAQLIGLLCSAAATVALFFTARSLARSTPIAAGIALLLIFSRTFWTYALQLSPYVPLVAALSLLALAIVTRGDGLQDDKRAIAAVSLPYAGAILLHQAAILVGFALAVYVFASRPWRAALRALVWVGAVPATIILASYLAAFSAIYGAGAWSWPAMVKYMTRYASIGNPCCATFANYSWPGLTALLEGHFEAMLLPPWGTRLTAVYLFGGGLLLLLLWNVVRALGERTGLRAFFVAWLVVILLFLLWAYPYGGIPPMLDIVPLLALLSLTIGDVLQFGDRMRFSAAPRWVFALGIVAAVAIMGSRNLDDGVRPLHASLGKKYEKATLIVGAVPKQCTVTEGDQEVLMNMYYYYDRAGLDVWDLMQWFYFGSAGKIPFTWDQFSFSKHDCIAIEARWLAPTMPIQQRVGDLAPDRWYAFIEWLLGFGYRNGSVASMRCLDAVADAQTARYLLIDVRRRCDVAGFEAVIGQLDTLLAARDTERGTLIFSDWFARYGSLVPGFKQRTVRDRLE